MAQARTRANKTRSHAVIDLARRRDSEYQQVVKLERSSHRAQPVPAARRVRRSALSPRRISPTSLAPFRSRMTLSRCHHSARVPSQLRASTECSASQVSRSRCTLHLRHGRRREQTAAPARQRGRRGPDRLCVRILPRAPGAPFPPKDGHAHRYQDPSPHARANPD